MEDVVNRLARELADAIAAAISDDPKVEACREKARAAGYEMKVSLEAVVGFVNRPSSNALARIPVQARTTASSKKALEMSANDKRFLRSLRIAADEHTEEEVE
jgi:hypothetical protein